MQIIMTEESSDQRLDRFLRKYFKSYPEVKLWDIFLRLRKGNIKVNGKKSKENYRLLQWDKVDIDDGISIWQKTLVNPLQDKEQKISSISDKTFDKLIFYEDDNRLAWNKPAWVVIHPSNKHRNDLCMNDFLKWYTEKKVDFVDSEVFKPAFGFRLDKDTSGVLIAAKNYEALKYLNQIIRERKIDKEYMTIVQWGFPQFLSMNSPLEKVYNTKFDRSQVNVSKNWKESKTEAWNVKTYNHKDFGLVSLVRVKIYTGRMHQIRVHLSDSWFPVVWDIIYGNPVLNRILYKKLKINRHLLHCWKYSFQNLGGRKIKFEAEVPWDFDKIIPLQKQ